MHGALDWCLWWWRIAVLFSRSFFWVWRWCSLLSARTLQTAPRCRCLSAERLSAVSYHVAQSCTEKIPTGCMHWLTIKTFRWANIKHQRVDAGVLWRIPPCSKSVVVHACSVKLYLWHFGIRLKTKGVSRTFTLEITFLITFVPASSRVQSSCMTSCWTPLKLSHTVYAIYIACGLLYCVWCWYTIPWQFLIKISS